jgi:hypothetical protein
MTASFNARNAVAALVVAGLVLLPLYSSLSGNIFILTLFTRIVIFALAAVSLNLIMVLGAVRAGDRRAVVTHPRRLFHHDHAGIRADGLLRRLGTGALRRR